MRRRAKQALTLIELMVALLLTGLLLAVLWQGYCAQQQVSRKIEKEKILTQKLLFCKQRIEKILFQFAHEGTQHILFTPTTTKNITDTLCFSYEQTADPDPSFTGIVKSLLYTDETKQLCLATWSSEQQCRIEILHDNVLQIKYGFFDPDTNTWHDSWPESFTHPPSWLRLQMSIVDQKETPWFFWKIGIQEGPIFYPENNL